MHSKRALKTPLSPTETFKNALQAGKGKRARMDLADIQGVFRKVFPKVQRPQDARQRLWRLLQALAAEQVVMLPVGRTAWDRRVEPALPNFIKWPAMGADATAFNEAKQHAWPPELQFARNQQSMTPGQLAFLLAVEKFLANVGPDEPVLTVRERSLRLLGDDKALDDLMDGRLFSQGRLSLAMLRCRRVFTPLVVIPTGRGPDALVVENKDTFQSACAAARRTGEIGWVVYGAGRTVVHGFPGLMDWPVQPRTWWYFGDVDAAGLRIGAELEAKARLLGGTGPVKPAGPLYDALVERCREYRVDLDADACSPKEAHALAAWLPERLQGAVVELLERGKQWPQEAVAERDLVVGLERMRELDGG